MKIKVEPVVSLSEGGHAAPGKSRPPDAVITIIVIIIILISAIIFIIVVVIIILPSHEFWPLPHGSLHLLLHFIDVARLTR